MGCNSGKVAKPTSLSRNASTAQNTLLSPVGKEGQLKEPIKPPQASIEGAWTGGLIKGNFVTWASGNVSPVRTSKNAGLLAQEVLDSATLIGVLELPFEGGILRGELLADDIIHWSDGETWSRLQLCSSFQEYMGYIDHGPDLLVQSMTLEEAKAKAACMPACQGFTYEEAPNYEIESMKVYFKSSWNNQGSRSGWRSFRPEPTGCAVGDQVTAIFRPTGRRYAAEIQSISIDLEEVARRITEVNPVSCPLEEWSARSQLRLNHEEYSRTVLDASEITVKWKDGGKTHRVLSGSHVFKDDTSVIDHGPSQDDLDGDPLCRVISASRVSTQASSGTSSHGTSSYDDADAALPEFKDGTFVRDQGPSLDTDAAALTLPDLEDPSPSSSPTRMQAPLSALMMHPDSEASPSSALMHSSGGGKKKKQGNCGIPAWPCRKEKSMCCC